jgi:hypothetical protein
MKESKCSNASSSFGSKWEYLKQKTQTCHQTWNPFEKKLLSNMWIRQWHTHYQGQWNKIWLIKLLFWKVQVEQDCWHPTVDSTGIWTPKFGQHGTAIEKMRRKHHIKRYMIISTIWWKYYMKLLRQLRLNIVQKLWRLLVLKEQIPLGKEVWADKRCYYLDTVQSIPKPGRQTRTRGLCGFHNLLPW